MQVYAILHLIFLLFIYHMFIKQTYCAVSDTREAEMNE